MAVLVSTLLPQPTGEHLPNGRLCLLCAPLGFADFLRNVLLFLPLGLLVGSRLGAVRAALLALIFSGTIEGVQMLVPGRFPALGDVVANATGGFVGALIVRRRSAVWRMIRSPDRAQRGSILAVVSALVVLPALLYRPSYPAGVTYHVQWTADLGAWLEPYGGTLLCARVGGVPMPQGPVAATEEWLRPALRDALSVELSVVVGPSPERLAPVFSIFDESQREILLIGARGTDLVVRRRDVASRLGLDGAEHVWGRALPEAMAGDTVAVRIDQARHRLCVAVDQEERCNLAPGLEMGWAFVFNPVLPTAGRRVAGFLWLGLLGWTAGLCAIRAHGAAAAGLALALLGAAVGWMAPALSLHLPPLLGLPLGALVGWRFPRGLRGAVDGERLGGTLVVERSS